MSERCASGSGSDDETTPSGRHVGWSTVLGWVCLLGTVLFLVFFLLPRKGVDFADEGWILKASLMAAHGQHLDMSVPQAPFWAFNGLLMAAGLKSYIALRWVFYGLISLCLWVALCAIDRRRERAGIRIALVSFAGLTTLESLVSYNNTPIYLILASAGLMWLALQARAAVARQSLALLAGVVLAITGFLNFTLYPACLGCWLIVWLAARRPRLLWMTALVTAALSAAGIAWYLHRVGLGPFLQYPGGHGVHVNRLTAALRIVLEWFVFWQIARWLLRALSRIRSGPPPSGPHPRGAALLLLIFSGAMLLVLLERLCPTAWPFALASYFPPLRFVGLAGLANLHQCMPYNVIGTWALALLVFALTLGDLRSVPGRRVLLASAILFGCWVCQVFFSLMDARGILVFYAGPCFALGFYLLYAAFPRQIPLLRRWVLPTMALALTFAGAVAYSLYYNHPVRNPVLGAKVPVAVPQLEGLMESPARAETLRTLYESYDKYGCRGRTMVTFQTTPFLYYLFEAESPPGLDYIFVPYAYNPKLILETLRHSDKWCVYVSLNWLRTAGNEEFVLSLSPVLDYLRDHSRRTIRLSPHAAPVHMYDDFVLYLGENALPVSGSRTSTNAAVAAPEKAPGAGR